MRYGHQNNLDFLLPNVKNYVGNPAHFNTSMANNNYSTVDGQYDIFVHHTRYSQDVKSVMRSGAVYTTILRNPVTLFQSMYTFYNFENKYKTNLTKFITNYKPSFAKQIKRYNNKLGLNQMSWDLGLDSKDFENTKMIKEHIHMIEKDFNFVMIFEYLDASLVLLANEMRWPLEQMAYLPLNTRHNSYTQMLSDHNVNQLKQVNLADNILYNQFLKKFKEKINEFGIEKLKKEIGKLMVINQETWESCVKSTTNHGYARTISYRLKENASVLCKYIAINELEYTSFLRKIQHEKQRRYKELDKLMSDN